MRNAKIVCTLGPASDDLETIKRLAEAGMAVGRINASHGSLEERKELIRRVKEVDRVMEVPVSTMLDLQGPEIRTATIDHPIDLAEGTTVRFVEGDDASSEEIGLSVGLDGVAEGDRVLIDDGRIETVVTEVTDEGVVARVVTGGSLGSRRGVNIPGVMLDIRNVSEADRAELRMATELGVDFIAASFVRDASDVIAINEILDEFGVEIPVIAKIERSSAISELDDIIEESYGIMVARGDLGVECPLEEVPLIQKRIIRQSQRAGAPVITATEMLDSMLDQPRPTRAEASDVANAVLDGTDAVMLSGETAVGDHPVLVVETMDRIIREVEESNEYSELLEQRVPPADDVSTGALARSARYLARDVGASAIVVASESGFTALKTTKYRPEVPIVAATTTDTVRRQLSLSWGVISQYADLGAEGAAGVIENAVEAALATDVVKSGDTIVVVSGMMTDLDWSTTNTLKVHVASETIGTGRGVVIGRAAGPLVKSSSGELTDIPPESILYLGEEFNRELSGELSRLIGIIHERSGMTGYPAMVARELGIPMASGVVLPSDVAEGTMVTIDGERGVVYRGDVTRTTETT